MMQGSIHIWMRCETGLIKCDELSCSKFVPASVKNVLLLLWEDHVWTLIGLSLDSQFLEALLQRGIDDTARGTEVFFQAGFISLA